MPLEIATNSILTGWGEEHTRLFDDQTIRVNHRLNETSLFTKAAIAALIDLSARDQYEIYTPDHNSKSGELRYGEIGELSGSQVLKAVKNGQFVLNLFDPGGERQDYLDILQTLSSELSARVPHFNVVKHNMILSISSPHMSTTCQADNVNKVRWQLAGKKRLWLYPTTSNFLSPDDLEKIVFENKTDNLPYEPWFDTYARSLDVSPGEMTHWPLYAPYRTENSGELNIELITIHETWQARKTKLVNYANGLLRRRLETGDLSNKTRGLNFYSKAAISLVHQAFSSKPPIAKPHEISFRLDLKNPRGMVDISEEDRAA